MVAHLVVRERLGQLLLTCLVLSYLDCLVNLVYLRLGCSVSKTVQSYLAASATKKCVHLVVLGQQENWGGFTSS